MFYLADGAVNSEVREEAHAGHLICPYPGCPAPQFIAKGGSERRHHFAHRVAGQEHRSSAVWRHQALVMLTEWLASRYPQLDVAFDDREGGESVCIRSPGSGRVVGLTVTYDRRHQPPASRSGAQLLVGHSRALLLPRREATDTPGSWWCGESRVVGDIVADRGWALAINPQERLIATITTSELARSARLIKDLPNGPLLCVVDELEHAHLDADGLHTRTSDAIDGELKRRRAAEAELQRRLEAHAQAHALRAAETRLERHRAGAETPRHPRAPRTGPRPPHEWSPEVLAADDERWPRDLDGLRQLLDDENLAQRVERPLSSDVACDVPPAIWHLMAVLEWQARGGEAHPLAIRAAIVQSGCGYGLTGEAIAGVLAVAKDQL